MAIGATQKGSDGLPSGSVVSQGIANPAALMGGGQVTDANGNILAPVVIEIDDSSKATYSASYVALAGFSGYIFALIGSSTKTVKLVRMVISGLATTATTIDITLEKWTSAGTAGTVVTAASMAAHDSNDGAATASAAAYSAGGAAGTIAGIIRAEKLSLPLAASNQPRPVIWEFEMAKNPTLHGVAQKFAVKLGAAPTGGSINVSCIWTEE